MKSVLRAGSAIALLAAMLPGVGAAQRRDAPASSRELERLLATPLEQPLRAHTVFLADDLLRGRAPGSAGGEVAAKYVASQFAAIGLEPAGEDGSFFQDVSLVGLTPQASLVVAAGRNTTPFLSGRDYVAWPGRIDSSFTVDGDLVFVGHGIQSPEWNWDDLSGVPLAGRILLFLANDPGVADSTSFRGGAMTYYGHWRYKFEQAARLGAAGALIIHNDDRVPFSWPVVQATWSGEQFMSANQPQTTLRFGAWITEAAARRLVATVGVDFDLLLRRALRPDFRAIDLGIRAAVHVRSRVRTVRSMNVVARLPGTDTRTLDQAVVYVAHYDHLGVRAAEGADSIFNGAVDNATGVATLLTTAATLARTATPLGRSIVFVATTAAEPNLLGAASYIKSPSVPVELTAAVFNVDGANVLGPTRDAMAVGLGHTTLDSVFARAARAESLAVTTDPYPSHGRVFASDHFAFLQAGVPALQVGSALDFVGRPATWGLEEYRDYRMHRYHRPTDEYNPEMDFAGLAQQVRVLVRMGWELARGDQFPAWFSQSPYRPAGEQLRLRRERRVVTGQRP